MNRHERRAQAAQQRRAQARPWDFAQRRERANQKLRGLVRQAYVDYDREMAGHLARQGYVGERLPCKEGCAHCCEQVVFVTIPEAVEIVVRYPEVVESVYAELERQEALGSELGITKRVVNIFDRTTNEERSAFLSRWFEARVPCAFLDLETKRCRIYEARPLNCRSYFVHDQPAEVCGHRREEATAKGTLKMNLVQSLPAYLHTADVLEKLSTEVFQAIGIGPLPVLVLAAYDMVKKDVP